MIDSKCHQCRRAGVKLFLKGERCFSQKCAMVRHPNPPGMHGAKKKRAGSEFGIQLLEKQKVKRSYGLREAQFRKYFEMARKKKAVTSATLAQILETRLDNTVFRLGFFDSRSQARQAVSHGHFTVNGRRVDIPSYQMKTGDIIGIRAQSVAKALFKDLRAAIKKYEPPVWLSLDKEQLKGEVKRMPVTEDIEMPFDLQLITEFYSK